MSPFSPSSKRSPLYSRFHLDEPWDSPHNLALLEPTPFVYACPSDLTRKPGTTGYLAVIGSRTAFTPDFRLLSFRDFTDGTSNTLIVGESLRSVPWTKPEDLPLDLSVPLSGLGSHHGYHNNGFNALFADGSVRFLKHSISPSVLVALSREAETRSSPRMLTEVGQTALNNLSRSGESLCQVHLDNQVLPAWLAQHAPVGLGLDRVLGPCGVASLHHSHAVAIKSPRITKGYLDLAHKTSRKIAGKIGSAAEVGSAVESLRAAIAPSALTRSINSRASTMRKLASMAGQAGELCRTSRC